MFEYTTVTLKVKGAKSGVLSYFQDKSIEPDSFRILAAMGKDGWDLVSVMPLAVGAVGGQWVDSAICFLKRKIEPRTVGLTTKSTSADSRTIGSAELDVLIRRHEMAARIRETTDGSVQLTEDDWSKLTSVPVPEAQLAVEQFVIWKSEPRYGVAGLHQEEIRKVRDFLCLLPRPNQVDSVYRLMERPKTCPHALELVRELQLFDADSLSRLFDSPEFVVRVNALNAVFVLKTEYEQGDIEKIESLMKTIAAKFPEAQLTEKRGVFGGVNRLWTCIRCRSELPEASCNCPPCSADRHGVEMSLGGFQGVMEALARRVDVLKKFFAAPWG